MVGWRVKQHKQTESDYPAKQQRAQMFGLSHGGDQIVNKFVCFLFLANESEQSPEALHLKFMYIYFPFDQQGLRFVVLRYDGNSQGLVLLKFRFQS